VRWCTDVAPQPWCTANRDLRATLPDRRRGREGTAMRWILVLYWSLNGQVVLNHTVFEARAPCEARIVSLGKVFDYLDHDQWHAICQLEAPA
jgi:hypothetical protein